MFKTFHIICFALICAGLIWSGLSPHDYPTWAMEVAPVLVILPLLIFTYHSFRLTDLLYALIVIHCWILMVGGHYTYANVPLFNWIMDLTGATRNGYDGVGHFAQGFIPAIGIRELLLRRSGLSSRQWLNATIIFGCLGISALYEIIEWVAALMLGQGADEFLGTQGDVWDTQKDMALAGLGAIAAILALGKYHDQSLSGLTDKDQK